MNSIRRIDENGKYQTLVNGLAGAVNNFVIDSTENRLFYASTEGDIYCRWLNPSEISPANCNGAKIEIPSYFPKSSARQTDGMALVEDGLLISAGRVILKYSY